MKELAVLLNDMLSSGVISDYAVFGAVAQMRYTEPVGTLDVDVLVTLPSTQGLDLLAPIYSYCREHGHLPEGEAIRVGAWPVQFIPVFSPLTAEAVAQADTADFEGVPLRVVRADHLAVVALSVADSPKREVLELLARQSAWQQSRRRLTWAEKVRLVEAVRASIAALRRSAPPRA